VGGCRSEATETESPNNEGDSALAEDEFSSPSESSQYSVFPMEGCDGAGEGGNGIAECCAGAFSRPMSRRPHPGSSTMHRGLSAEERELLRSADRVLFPTPRFAPIFHAVGIRCFPSYYSYRYQRSRFLQKTLLEVLAVPRPKSRVYFGSRQKRGILKEFSPPFLLMGVPMNSPDAYVIGSPKGSRRGLGPVQSCSRPPVDRVAKAGEARVHAL